MSSEGHIPVDNTDHHEDIKHSFERNSQDRQEIDHNININNNVNNNGFIPSNHNRPEADIKEFEHVIYSDIGLNILLERLKQSISSARDFSLFLRKRSLIEEEHAKSLKRLSKTTSDILPNIEGRQGSFARQMTDAMRTHDRIGDNEMQFALSIHQMHEDLNELANSMEKGRKTWKHDGLDAEKRASDAESLMQKAKAKYDGLAQDYDHARTGDIRGSQKLFKGTRNSAQYEEDVHKKLLAADADYAEKVNAARMQRDDLVNSFRPKVVKALQDLIYECDSALTLQLQKFATFNERLLVGNGILITPLSTSSTLGEEQQQQNSAGHRSMRDIFIDIDNDGDLYSYILSQRIKVPPKKAEIQYYKHPTLITKQPDINPSTTNINNNRIPFQPNSIPNVGGNYINNDIINNNSSSIEKLAPIPPQKDMDGSSRTFSFERNTPSPPRFNQYSSLSNNNNNNNHSRDTSQSLAYTSQTQPPPTLSTSGHLSGNIPGHLAGDEPLGALPQFTSFNHNNNNNNNNNFPRPPSSNGNNNPPPTHIPHIINSYHHQQQQQQQSTPPPPPSSLPFNNIPSKPIFGTDLATLFSRDNTAVPMVVYQCIQAVEQFGLNIEGIYRQNGNAHEIQRLKDLFNTSDHNNKLLDFRNPANFSHDVNIVAGLLKQFFRELPDPLLTREKYNEILTAGRIEDDTIRRDTLHAIINGLPDANYATLRTLVLHLNRVQENQAQNRMSSNNLAICFAPSLMGGSLNGGTGNNGAVDNSYMAAQVQDSGILAKVLDTILLNTFRIFDED